MNALKVFPIGKIVNNEKTVCVKLNPALKEGLKGLSEYSHLQVLWWFNGCDNDKDRSTLLQEKPYKNGPEEIGVFALRSPERPNPIAVSNVNIAYVDEEAGVVGLYYIDAFNGSEVLDLKPYTPSIDRIETSRSPQWCSHWPQSYEASAEFDWEAEFNFEDIR